MNWERESFRKRLKKAIRESAETQDTLAKKLGFQSQSSISQWVREKDATVPTVEQIGRLATALNVSPSWLAYGDESTPMDRRESAVLDSLRALPPAYAGPFRDFIGALARVHVKPAKQPDSLTPQESLLVQLAIQRYLERFLARDPEFAALDSASRKLERLYALQAPTGPHGPLSVAEARITGVEVPSVPVQESYTPPLTHGKIT